MTGDATVGAGAVGFIFCGMTDLGRVRKNNEDNYVVYDLAGQAAAPPGPGEISSLGSRGALLLVADGMGGEACGEVASTVCAEVLPRRLGENLQTVQRVDAAAFAQALKQAIAFANQTIFAMARGNPLYAGMGTTVTAAGLIGSSLVIGQVGDSRAYLFRNGRGVQLTRDQTLLNYLADLGAPLPADLENDNRKNILTQAVGSAEALDIKLTCSEVRRGDLLLLCSDGLYNMVKNAEALKILSSNATLESRCRSLIEAANARGGTDNITVVLAELKGSGWLEPDREVSVAECSDWQSSVGS